MLAAFLITDHTTDLLAAVWARLIAGAPNLANAQVIYTDIDQRSVYAVQQHCRQASIRTTKFQMKKGLLHLADMVNDFPEENKKVLLALIDLPSQLWDQGKQLLFYS